MEKGSSLPTPEDVTHNDVGNQTCLKFPNSLYVISQVSSMLFGLLAGYATVSLTLHHLLVGKRVQSRDGTSRKVSGMNPEHERRARFYKKMMNVHMILSSLWITIRCLLDFAVLRTGHLSNPNYIQYSMVEILLNIATLSSMYFVLWLRQWSFYTHPAMEDVKFRKLRSVCVFLLVIMVATGIWNATAFLMERNEAFSLSRNECIFETNGSMHKFYVLGACTLFYQIVLLGLFGYPLILHSKRNIIAESSKKKSIMRVLKRVFIAAVICCVTDMVTSIVSAVLESVYPESSFLVYNLNIFVNFIALMYSFGDWKTRLWYPFLLCQRAPITSWSSSTAPSNASSQF